MRLFGNRKKCNSVHIAKDRLRLLLVSERMNCTPDQYERLYQELYQTISKYLEITPDYFKLKITESEIHISFTGD